MRAVVYSRTSTLDQAREEKVSIPDQINWAKTFALERGWEWVTEYIEPGVVGDTEPEDRESLSRLLADARNDNFDIVLVSHSSRLAREADIGLKICRVLGQLGKQIYFKNAPIEPVPVDKFAWGNNIGSQYMTAFSFIGDFQENVARSERVRSGFQGLAKKGVLTFAPFGYKKIPKITTDEFGKQKYTWHFEIDPINSIIVKNIFDKYLSPEGSIRKIMLEFNLKAVPSPTNKISNNAWTTATIKNILTNPAYIGKVRWGRKLGGKYLQGKYSSGKQRRVIVPPDKWIVTDGSHPKIIDELVFYKVQDKLKLRWVIKGRAVASEGLLTGLIKCGRCGSNAYFRRRNGKTKVSPQKFYYACGSYYRSGQCQQHVISAKKVHDIILSDLNKIASNKAFREKLLSNRQDESDSLIFDSFDLFNQEKESIQKKQQRILNAYENGALSLEEFGQSKNRLDQDELKVISEIDKINTLLSDKTRSEQAKKAFLQVLDGFIESFEIAPLKEQKSLLQSLINSVVVKEPKIKINYRI